MKYYAGIGSRQTPTDVLVVMTSLAKKLSDRYILRSGGAIGADLAFENGCTGNGDCEIFLAHHATPEARFIASEFHPYWENLPEYTKNLHGRNAMIILGRELRQPVNFVVCWTKDGMDSGGTGLAMRIAQSRGIRVINLFYPEWMGRVQKFITTGESI